MKLSGKDALQLAARKVSFGHGVADSSKRLLMTLHQILNSDDEFHLYEALVYARDIKNSIHEIDNVLHELSCLAAKAFLERQYPQADWKRVNALEKDVNAPGPDLLIVEGNVRIVAEVKTTEPKSTKSFGSKKNDIIKDLEKLSSNKYSGFDRYFFVVSPKAIHILEAKYKSQYPSINFELLTPRS
jgi:hypothetical protein